MNRERKEIEAMVEGLLQERILELLDEIPDFYSNSAFDQEDRDNIRNLIQMGKLSDELPAPMDMLDAIIRHWVTSGWIDDIDLDDDRMVRQRARMMVDEMNLDDADIASMYIANVVAPKASMMMDQIDWS